MTFSMAKKKEYVCGFMFVGDEVVLIRKARPEWQAGRLNGVGGKIEESEHEGMAIAREFFEETGFVTTEHSWLHRVTLETDDSVIYFFVSFAKEKFNLVLENDEPCDWYDVYNLPKNIIPNLRWLIPICCDLDLIGPIPIYENAPDAKFSEKIKWHGLPLKTGLNNARPLENTG